MEITSFSHQFQVTFSWFSAALGGFSLFNIFMLLCADLVTPKELGEITWT